jgi:beta-1,4-mannosyl-glycoprotein beta-1,4-N-acetylglucosaminyltransferase
LLIRFFFLLFPISFLCSNPKIYDGFLFFNELEILEMRLKQHAPHVDYFILVESKETFRGDPKPLYFDENKERFAPFLSKIIHIVVERKDFSEHEEPFWSREAYQRNQIFLGLKEASKEDTVLISDVDELIDDPVFNRLKIYARQKKGIIKSICLNQHQFYLNLKHSTPYLWVGPIVCRKKNLFQSSADDLRRNRNAFQKMYGGWHFTYMGGGDKIQQKLKAFSETVYDELIDEQPAKISLELFARCNKGYEWAEIDSSYPRFILENIDYYKNIGFIPSTP